MRELIRHVRIEAIIGRPFTLELYDTGEIDWRHGPKQRLAYVFKGPDGKVVFEGNDFCCSPMHAIDSDACVRSLLGFLTLRPGDTDDEYFADYTEAQKAFCEADAEALSVFGCEDSDDPLEDLPDSPHEGARK